MIFAFVVEHINRSEPRWHRVCSGEFTAAALPSLD
jgi:hypothetical protein